MDCLRIECLRKGEGAAGGAAEAEVEEALHDGRDGDITVGADVRKQQVAELLAERVGHLRVADCWQWHFAPSLMNTLRC